MRGLARRIYNSVGRLIDYVVYARGALPYRRLLKPGEEPSNRDRGSLLIVAGNGMNVLWAQLWTILSVPIRRQGYRTIVLTTRANRSLNRYFRLLDHQLLYLDELDVPGNLPEAVLDQVSRARTFDDFRAIRFEGAPVGEIALSTYSRNFGTGVIRLEDPVVLEYVRHWAREVCSLMRLAGRIYDDERVEILFFTEVFMEEYGAFYYAALERELNIVRFAGTVRDDAFIMQRLTRANDRIHHASLDPTTFERVLSRTDDPRMEAELMENFRDRYGERWHRSKRNHPNTLILDPAEARESLGISTDRKVAVVYSHILYDTLFFFGTDLFNDYSEWLIQTTRAAIGNPEVEWLIKVHPSNLWRGEMETLLGGRYEEERLLASAVGDLPPHVRIVGADTQINPLTWFQLADYGITVRGTSGLEMAALGKTVITAGTGRYEGNGFTVDPTTAEEYLDILSRLHELPEPSPENVRRARRYAHAIFVLKPFTLTSMRPRLKTAVREVLASDDLVYVPRRFSRGHLPHDLARFGEWVTQADDRDLLTVTDSKGSTATVAAA